jgi:hypothetical protein
MIANVTIDFIYDSDCPNVAQSRENLLRAIASTGVQAHLREWESSAPDIPAELRFLGSPTILVDGNDLDGRSTEPAAACCRLYATSAGTTAGVPSVELIERALRQAPRQARS